MILDEIVLYNFGVFAGRQSVVLTPPSSSKPVVLIGALNGGGKTTFLDAIQLCLFGPQARCSNRNSLSYDEFLTRCIHRQASSMDSALELEFRHTIDGVEDSYRLFRSWYLDSGNCKEKFEVHKNGQFDRAMTENWLNQVEDFIPHNIAHLFLFDGEKIEGYAAQESSASLIGAAIQNLLGLDVIDQLEKDLHTLDRRKKNEEKDDKAKAEIEDLEAQIRDLSATIEKHKQEFASIQTHKLGRQRKRLNDVRERYSKLGGELYNRREHIEKEKATAETHLAETAKELRDLASGPLPFMFVQDLINKAIVRDQDELFSKQAHYLLDVLVKRDSKLLAHLKKQSASAETLKQLGKFLEKDLEKRKQSSENKPVLEVSDEGRRILHSLDQELKSLTSITKNLLLKHQTSHEQVEHYQLEFDSIPSADTVEAVKTEYESIQKDIAKAEVDSEKLKSEIERLSRDIERKQQSLARLLERDVEGQLKREDRERTLMYSGKVRTTLSHFRKAVVERHIRRIEHLVLESYQHLLRKRSLVSNLEINPENFELTLYGSGSRPLSTDRLSAGERQLLAIALLWGLAKASGRPMPAAIDTPLGRLDTIHRMHLVKRYFPYASHQVLLLSTDEEIVDEYLEALQPNIGRSYHFEHNDRTGATHIKSGYFNEARMVAV